MTKNDRETSRLVAGAGAVLAALPASGAESIHQYTTALIGCGGWGQENLKAALGALRKKDEDPRKVRIVALCDVKEDRSQATAANLTAETRQAPRTYSQAHSANRPYVAYSDLLTAERPEIVIVATPDHWHALPAVEAINRGAHVLVASPLSHTVREGQAIKTAAAKGNGKHRVVGAAAHWRYAPHVRSAKEFLRSGKVGTIGFVRAFHNEARQPEQATENEPIPPGLAWDYWCGPAPKRRYNKLIYNDFSCFLDYGNGTLGREGTQWLDLALWFMETMIDQRRERQGTTDAKREILWPRRVFSTGGRPVLGLPINLELQDEEQPGARERGRQTSDQPDNQVAVFDFGAAAVPFSLVWQHRLFAANAAEKVGDSGCYFYGTEGTFHLGWQQGWTFYPVDKNKPPVSCPPEEKPKEKTTHYLKELWEDFLGAITKETQPACGIEDAYRAATLTQLAMISLKSGRSIQWDGQQEIIVGDAYATSLLKRDYRPGYAHPSVS